MDPGLRRMTTGRGAEPCIASATVWQIFRSGGASALISRAGAGIVALPQRRGIVMARLWNRNCVGKAVFLAGASFAACIAAASPAHAQTEAEQEAQAANEAADEAGDDATI